MDRPSSSKLAMFRKAMPPPNVSEYLSPPDSVISNTMDSVNSLIRKYYKASDIRRLFEKLPPESTKMSLEQRIQFLDESIAASQKLCELVNAGFAARQKAVHTRPLIIEPTKILASTITSIVQYEMRKIYRDAPTVDGQVVYWVKASDSDDLKCYDADVMYFKFISGKMQADVQELFLELIRRECEQLQAHLNDNGEVLSCVTINEKKSKKANAIEGSGLEQNVARIRVYITRKDAEGAEKKPRMVCLQIFRGTTPQVQVSGSLLTSIVVELVNVAFKVFLFVADTYWVMLQERLSEIPNFNSFNSDHLEILQKAIDSINDTKLTEACKFKVDQMKAGLRQSLYKDVPHSEYEILSMKVKRFEINMIKADFKLRENFKLTHHVDLHWMQQLVNSGLGIQCHGAGRSKSQYCMVKDALLANIMSNGDSDSKQHPGLTLKFKRKFLPTFDMCSLRYDSEEKESTIIMFESGHVILSACLNGYEVMSMFMFITSFIAEFGHGVIRSRQAPPQQNQARPSTKRQRRH